MQPLGCHEHVVQNVPQLVQQPAHLLEGCRVGERSRLEDVRQEVAARLIRQTLQGKRLREHQVIHAVAVRRQEERVMLQQLEEVRDRDARVVRAVMP